MLPKKIFSKILQLTAIIFANNKKNYNGPSEISSTGGWNGKIEHFFDEGMAQFILKFCRMNKLKTVSDLGAGSQALYSIYFKNGGLDVKAYDYNKEILKIKELNVQVIDLAYKNNFIKSDLALCLEVGEHIPLKFEDVFVQNIVNAAINWLIISWAILGQQGHGHVNCKNNFMVIDIFRNHGFEIDYIKTRQIRNSAQLSWFKNTLFIFKRGGK